MVHGSVASGPPNLPLVVGGRFLKKNNKQALVLQCRVEIKKATTYQRKTDPAYFETVPSDL